MQPREGALDDPAHAAETGAVLGLAASDLRADAASTELAAVLVVVVATISGDLVWTLPRPAGLAAHRRHTVDQRDQLRDVIAIAASNPPGERNPGRVYEKVMLGAVSGSINRARARRGAPFFACT
jgi:hypothetical protein